MAMNLKLVIYLNGDEGRQGTVAYSAISSEWQLSLEHMAMSGCHKIDCAPPKLYTLSPVKQQNTSLCGANVDRALTR